MNVIIFKAYLINKLAYWFFSIILIALALFYFKFNLTSEERNISCGALIGVGFLIILYINRLEPKLIKFDKENVEITYFSPPPYGRGTKTYNRNELSVLKENDLLVISNQAGIVARMRRKALDIKDWKTLVNYFD